MSASFLIKFKGELWDFCMKNKIFENITQDKYEEVKKIMDNSVENYKTHILQNDSNYTSLFTPIANEMNPLISRLKTITRDERINQQKSEFNSQVEAKQKEFEQLMNKNAPEPVNFSDTKTDEPLTNSNLDRLIEEQIKQRESLGIQNIPISSPNQTDTVVQDKITASIPLSEENVVLENNLQSLDRLTSPNNYQSLTMNKNDNIDKILNVVEEINKNQKLIISVMNKMIKSQINILEKLK
jgi:hypothetical protein